MVKRSITTQLTVVLALVSAVVLAGFAVMLIAARSLQSADRARARSNTVLAAASNLEESVLDLETGLRGYLLAGKPVFLQPYNLALRRYPGVAATLEKAPADDRDAHSLSASMGAEIHSYVPSWSQPAIRQAGRDLAA